MESRDRKLLKEIVNLHEIYLESHRSDELMARLFRNCVGGCGNVRCVLQSKSWRSVNAVEKVIPGIVSYDSELVVPASPDVSSYASARKVFLGLWNWSTRNATRFFRPSANGFWYAERLAANSSSL